MGRKKAQTYRFRTIADLHVIPLEKLPAFCEDLRLWLSLHRLASTNGISVTTPPDEFGWIDDNRHDITVTLNVKHPDDVPSEVD